ncbi:MAG: DEAD/DEAH box helicase [Flavobacterium sp.]|nr:MAG: DEAD/DEAH box helicase [Flavobacterium sp.]
MLAEKLFKLKSFQRQYEALLILSVSGIIPDLIWETQKENLVAAIDWNNVLGIASALSYSDQNEHLDAALRIAQTAISEDGTSVTQKEGAAVILQSLTNKPAIKLAIERGRISKDFEEHLPLPLKLQKLRSDFENSITLGDQTISLNKFQTRVHNSYLENDAISISAPTSSGKSFILCSIIIEELLKGNRNIVYLVPTRALIAQVEDDLRKLLDKYRLSSVNLTTVPQYDTIQYDSNVFVFTQERLHWFLIEHKEFRLDIIIVDEAHKIEDPYRGILLQQKLEEVISANPKVKVYFSSPFTSNPELLLESISIEGKSEPINTQFIAVNQNLIYCTQVPRKSSLWELNLSLVDKVIKLGTLQMTDRPTSELKKMAFMSVAFSGNSTGNIIYCNGAAQAEDIALVLYDKLSGEPPASQRVKLLIDLVKKTVHSDYRLAKVLERKVAFHYGNMPLLIRQEIENLFKDGEIKYLICTSTLLEGVNLPAKSIFIRKPKRGSRTHLNQSDFWNLAGRAGRWGKEFSGNIICIEPADWQNPPNPEKKKQKIIRALDIIEAKQGELIEYIETDTPRAIAETRQDLEFAFGYYYAKFIQGSLTERTNLEPRLIELFNNVRERVQLPNEIITRNPGISPLAQQDLLEYFRSKTTEAESLIPVYPEDENAHDEYVKLVGRIGKTLSAYPAQLNTSRSILLMNWMSGKPLSYIITAAYNAYQRNEKYAATKNIHVVIREVMDNVETFARFQFAKDSSCYVDILRFFLNECAREDLLENIPQLNLWLEFGVSQKTHLSLLSLGLTRNTVVELSNYITNTNMTKEEALKWITEQDLAVFGLSPIILEDIRLKTTKLVN